MIFPFCWKIEYSSHSEYCCGESEHQVGVESIPFITNIVAEKLSMEATGAKI